MQAYLRKKCANRGIIAEELIAKPGLHVKKTHQCSIKSRKKIERN